MNQLPDEVILHILTYLEVIDAVRLQLVSRRLLTLGRDNYYWKIECFNHSRAEAIRRRQQSVLDARLIELRNAWSTVPGGDLVASNVAILERSVPPGISRNDDEIAKSQRVRALANWEPGYPSERLDYYDEYIHRHAPISIDWLDTFKGVDSEQSCDREATGIGVLRGEHGSSEKVLAPMDDGAVRIWDISTRETSCQGGRGKLIHSTLPGFLTGRSADAFNESHAIMTETGAVECISINEKLNRAYFGVQSLLHEVDLNTMQLVSSKPYPWPITAVSPYQSDHPVTVGTNWTIHLNDPRDSHPSTSPTTQTTELIGGSLYTHATLAQPGPLSILHQANTSLWIAGRFTHLLNYDRRFFPRLLGTIHSGARIASLSSIPHPYHRPTHPAHPGLTLYTAGSYKGKGSLELYDAASPTVNRYQNRQTASSSKLLSVSPHGGMIVFSDGDGNLKWVERDGHTPVRSFNINPVVPEGVGVEEGVFGQGEQGDIVQKIVPVCVAGEGGGRGRGDVNQSDLMLWTGDGRVGRLRFGVGSGGEEEFVDAVEDQRGSVEVRAREDAERQYGMAMRRALERNADEVRFVRGLGIF